jgi:hypothetical protein
MSLQVIVRKLIFVHSLPRRMLQGRYGLSEVLNRIEILGCVNRPKVHKKKGNERGIPVKVSLSSRYFRAG